MKRASERGVPINEVERGKVGKFLTESKEHLYDAIQGIVPYECRNLKPKRDLSKVKKGTGKGRGRRKKGGEENVLQGRMILE